MRFARFACLAASLALLGCKPSINDWYNALPSVGSTLPAFRYVALDGAVVTPESLRGEPAVIALWSTTCSASQIALSSIEALHTALAARGARVVILANDRDATVVRTAIGQAAESTPAAIAANSLQSTFTQRHPMQSSLWTIPLPTFFVIDAAGEIVYRQIGIEQNASERLVNVRAQVDSLLSRSGPRVGMQLPDSAQQPDLHPVSD
jgi:peroxiredoxin